MSCIPTQPQRRTLVAHFKINNITVCYELHPYTTTKSNTLVTHSKIKNIAMCYQLRSFIKTNTLLTHSRINNNLQCVLWVPSFYKDEDTCDSF